MGTTVRRGTRLLALALSTGTLTAAVAGVAGASTNSSSTITTHTVRTVVANATGSALEITINLPKGITLPDGSTSIHQSVSLTDGSVSTIGAVSALSNALLGKGNIPVVSSLLAKSGHASLNTKSNSYNDAVLAQQVGPINIGLGTLSGLVNKPTSVASGDLAKGQSELAHLTIAGSLPSAQIAAPVVKTLTDTLNSQLQSGSSTVKGIVDSAVQQLQGSPAGSVAQQAATTLENTLSSLSTTLSSLSNASAANLVSLDVINAAHEISQQATTVTSHAESALADINVLNGLVSVTGIKSAATASAGGTPGTAHTNFSAPLLHVSIAHGALDLLLDQTGLHVKSGVDALDQVANQLGGQLPGAINTIDGLLNEVAGINVLYGPAQHYESPDGTQAWAKVAAAELTIDPGLLHDAGLLDKNKQFIDVKLVPTYAFAGTTATVLPERITPPQLAHTGGNLPLVAGIGSALLALAFLARRLSYPPQVPRRTPSSELAGSASAAAAEVEQALAVPPDPHAAAFFDVDNTMMMGAAIYWFARGLAARKFFTSRDLARFALQQVRFRVIGAENPEHMQQAKEAALGFIAGHRVDELIRLGEEIYDELIAERIWSGTRALAEQHLDAGRRVWLVTAAPVELADIIARRLGLTGALGTVSEHDDNGVYTGKLVGDMLHGPAKSAAIRALAEREELDLAECWAYSDSVNDLPMLETVGHPVAINPDSQLLRVAKERGWQVRDYRVGRKAAKVSVPAAAGAGAVAGAIAVGIALRNRQRRRGRLSELRDLF